MFQSARIKLTLWYLLIIMSVSLAFSGVIYFALTREMARYDHLQRYKIEKKLSEGECYLKDGKINNAPTTGIYNPELITETQERILYVLFIVNGIVFVFSGVLGYLLAGRTLDPIKKMVDSQNRFISDASHELRTPLTSLKSTFEVFLRNKKRNLKEADTVIRESILEVDKLQKLSDSLLNLSHLEESEINHPKEHVSLNEVSQTAIKKIKPIADSKNIKLAAQGKNIMFHGFKATLEELFVILLDNAVKYSPKGTTVLIKMYARREDLIIKVVDEGAGIDEHDMPFIFDRFYRADKSRTSGKHKGHGLGLAIAQKIVETHNGEINVYNNKKSGVTFEVTLPRNS